MSAAGARLAAAGAVVLAALAVAAEATTFDVAFPTDPLGPKAFPMVAAALLVLGGGALVREARKEARRGGSGGSAKGAVDDPEGADAGAATGPAPGAARRIALATASFIAYAFLLAPLGFVPATTLEFTALGWLFGGPVPRSAAAGLVFAVLLYALFVFGLGLPLPLGIFEA